MSTTPHHDRPSGSLPAARISNRNQAAGGEDDGPLHLRIGLIGCGNIGAELVHQVMERAKTLEDAGFAQLEVTRIAVRDTNRPRPQWVPQGLITADPMEIAADPKVDLLVELAGGVEPARQWVEAALHTGKPVVTANKALMAEHGGELLGLAARLGLPLRYEASVGGGIPILRAIESGLAATRLDEIAGVINGTTNYILTQMEEAGVTFEQALAEAQRLGYAEADPTLDVEGIDAAQKLVILTGLAFGVEVPMEAIPVTGITKITRDYMAEQHKQGLSIRLVARARRG
ncbi:MAG: homoserine dehydrogenase, partial [Planctomycetota bacterium]